MDTIPTPRRVRHDGWTPARQQDFVAALCRGFSVTAAARSVGMSARSAYNLRAHPAAAGFCAAWDAAVAPAFMPAGPDLLERALARTTAPISFDGMACTRSRPIAAARLIRLIERGAARTAKLQKNAKG